MLATVIRLARAELQKRAIACVCKLVELGAVWCCGHYWHQ